MILLYYIMCMITDILTIDTNILMRTPPTIGSKYPMLNREHGTFLTNNINIGSQSSDSSNSSQGLAKVIFNNVCQEDEKLELDPNDYLVQSSMNDADITKALKKQLPSSKQNTKLGKGGRFRIIDNESANEYPQLVTETSFFQCLKECKDITIRALVDNTTENKRRRFMIDNESSSNPEISSNDQFQERANGDHHYPGSSDELKNRLAAIQESNDQRNFFGNLADNHNDIMANFDNFANNDNFLPNFDVQNSQDDSEDQNIFMRQPHMTPFETTLGTFKMRYMQSYSEINSILEKESKKRRNELAESIYSTGVLSFTELLSKYKASSINKADKIEVFMNLLHLQREGKVEKIVQRNPSEFSEIYIHPK